MTQREGEGKRGDEVLALFARGAEFTRELLQENERLRKELLDTRREQMDAARDPEDWNRLRLELINRIAGLEQEYASVRERLAQVEEENSHFAERYIEIEEENNSLANLYVASYQLHSTLDLDEVLKVLIEIAINLIGAESFAFYLLDEEAGELGLVASEAPTSSLAERIPVGPNGGGLIGEALRREEPIFTEGGQDAQSLEPLACIPLCVQGNPVGIVAIFRLFEQKESFSDLDRELFSLLGGHAATAIFASQLYAQSERKLNTIQGFIDLLTK